MADEKTTERHTKALPGDEIRLLCPRCGSMWSTLKVPSECPACAAQVNITARGGKPI